MPTRKEMQMGQINCFATRTALAVLLSLRALGICGAMADESALNRPGLLHALDPLIDFTEFCDLRDHAPISEQCHAFVGAIVEMNRAFDLYTLDHNDQYYDRSCIPRGTTINEIFERIRPWLRNAVPYCLGQCNSASYTDAQKS